MFSTTRLFKDIACPQGEECTLVSCIFSHDSGPLEGTEDPANPTVAEQSYNQAEFPDRDGVKRRRIEREQKKVPPKADNGPPKLVKTVPAGVLIGQEERKNDERIQKTLTSPASLRRPVSPPSKAVQMKTSVTAVIATPAKPTSTESLNPRMIPHDPAGHARRKLLLVHLYEQVKRLNREVAQSSHTQKGALELTEGELVKAALDEEEVLARGNSSLYGNFMKHRIAAYKKMKLEDWITYVKSSIATAHGRTDEKEPPSPPPLETGLPMSEEHVLLPRLISNQEPLARHGYVVSPPEPTDIAQAEATLALASNFEVCDRCKTRFQVFPDRRSEDGVLTTNGPCVHHWGRPVYPKREKTDAQTGSREPTYSCCHEFLNTPGCTEAETHAFKINDPMRMASVLPFIWTPTNPRQAKSPRGKVPKAVTFDCEMGYTTYGLELIRLTAVSWPEGDALVDVLVRPQGTILDLNSRFSGVWPESFASAFPYDLAVPAPPKAETPSPLPSERSSEAKPGDSPLPIVPSPAVARDLLCSFLTPETPLLGHALENDLNSVRLCHPRIIDTVVLFPHPRGLPIRYGLKMLTKRHLHRDIQMGGERGHDSLEDARATGDLVRYAVGQRWRDLSRDGWRIENGELQPPLPPDLPPAPASASGGTAVEGAREGRVLGGGSGTKRQRIEVETRHEINAKRQKAEA